MKGFFDDYNGVSIEIDIDDSTINEIMDCIEKGEIPFVRLENGKGDYMQCAGKGNMFTVELRVVDINSFKHFVIGTSLQSKVWQMIYCSVGPIRVLEHEVLSKSDAKGLLTSFYKEVGIPSGFIKRNVSKLYQK